MPIPTLRIPGFTLTAGVHAKGAELPWHAHDGATICLAVRGAFREYGHGRVTICYPSTLKVTPAGEPHWNRFDLGDTRGLLIEVDGSRRATLGELAGTLDERWQSDGGVAAAVAHRVYDEFIQRDSATPLAVEGLLLELLAAVARSAEPRGDPRARWLARARDLIRAGYTEPITLGGLAAAVGVHPVTLARGFRATYDCTVGEYVRRCRVEHAARELRRGDRPLSEIAFDCGFADQSHLSNVFRRYTGQTPGSYRMMARAG